MIDPFAATSPAVATDNLGEWVCRLFAGHGIRTCRECGGLLEPDRERSAVLCRPCAGQGHRGRPRRRTACPEAANPDGRRDDD